MSSIAFTSIASSRENLRHRSSCGQQQDRGGYRKQSPSSSGERALNKFLSEYDWDEQQFNHERLEEPQKHVETRWSQDGYIILDDTITEKTGDEVPGVGEFYDHAESDTVWGQDLIYAFYADDKTA